VARSEEFNRGLPESSEFRADPRDDADDRRILRHGRRVTLPLMAESADPYSGTLFTSAAVQPAPISVVRKDGIPDEQTTVVYFSWDYTQGGGRPDAPVALALIRWGVGSLVFSRMVDMHRIPRRVAIVANWIEVVAAYIDLGVPPANASIDALVGLASGEADANYWTGTWMQPLTGGPNGQICSQPAAILAMSGTLLALGAGTGAFIMAVDTFAAVSGTSRPIPGAVSPLLSVGQGFAFGEDEVPGVFAELGVAIAISTTPNLFVAPAGASMFVQTKLAF